MAIAVWPTWSVDESPMRAGVRPVASILMRARSWSVETLDDGHRELASRPRARRSATGCPRRRAGSSGCSRRGQHDPGPDAGRRHPERGEAVAEPRVGRDRHDRGRGRRDDVRDVLRIAPTVTPRACAVARPMPRRSRTGRRYGRRGAAVEPEARTAASSETATIAATPAASDGAGVRPTGHRRWRGRIGPWTAWAGSQDDRPRIAWVGRGAVGHRWSPGRWVGPSPTVRMEAPRA